MLLQIIGIGGPLLIVSGWGFAIYCFIEEDEIKRRREKRREKKQKGRG